MTAQMIRRFWIQTEFRETKMIQVKETMYRTILDIMREQGYAPLLDVNPVWATDYQGGEKFAGMLTVQGVHVGKDKAWEIQGVVDGKLIPYTPKSK